MPISEVHNEDCMAGMSRYPDKFWDLAIVDPPYGASDAINPKSSQNKYQAKRGRYKKVEWNVAPEDEYFNELMRVSKEQIIWGANFFGFIGGYIVWDKKGTAFGEGEMAWYSKSQSVRFFEYTWNGMLQQDMKNKELRIHPTQKPIALYKWLLTEYAQEGFKILDTHMGSQSSRIAAFNMGFDYWGWEIDKEYFEKGNQRFKEQTAQIQLF
jgi:site-specific DNA-methyltransferase (adenine-specific)